MNSSKAANSARLLALLLSLALPAALQAQFNYTNINGNITITGYTGTVDTVSIPSTLAGLPVTAIGYQAFDGNRNLVSVTIPGSVTNIGSLAFNLCVNLASVTISNGVMNIGDSAFSNCRSLTSVMVPNSVTNIGADTFSGCPSLANVTIGNGVTSIGNGAFGGCASLSVVYFQGNAPTLVGLGPFSGDTNATAYISPWTSGWGAMFYQLPTVLWTAQVQFSGAGFGVLSNQFGFDITGTSNMAVVVQACTNLANGIWSSVQTNTLGGGSSHFSDPQWTKYPGRFYRLSLPPP